MNNMEIQKFEDLSYVQHKYFNVGKMLLVKKLPNGAWYGVRYLADNKVLVYSEYHENELEPYQEPRIEAIDIVMI
ncbi:hypothetical protein [Pedobacter duraquae]|uniref:Uncharacterized protein n=1 Tax=Pedobacter duraquae TaxID=425511 RepID=A0A4R6IPB0_9SPHI|nr:hypothetical protein [Pedobacter duraquae]TDO23765.1 hypothetical protein CLV32_0050 [Pedobacter duraquae]